MSRKTWEHALLSLIMGPVVVVMMMGMGCSAARPPVALEQARAAYAQAQQSPAVVTQAPIAPFPHRSIASPHRRLTLTN